MGNSQTGMMYCCLSAWSLANSSDITSGTTLLWTATTADNLNTGISYIGGSFIDKWLYCLGMISWFLSAIDIYRALTP